MNFVSPVVIGRRSRDSRFFIGLILLVMSTVIGDAYAQEGPIRSNFPQIQEIQAKHLIDIRYKLLCTQGVAPEARGRGLILSRVGDYLLISTALHVLFPEAKHVSSLAGDSCAYYLELRKSRAEDSFASLDLPATLHSIAGAKEERPRLDLYSFEQLKKLLPSQYEDLIGWLPNQIPYLVKDPVDRDIVFMAIPVSKLKAGSFENITSTIDTVCGEEDVRKVLGEDHVVFLSGSASSSKGLPIVTAYTANTQNLESWSASEVVCPGDSGSPVFFWVRDTSCIKRLVFYGAVSFSDPFDSEGQKHTCNKNFRIARPVVLWNTLPSDPSLASAQTYAFLRCAKAAAIMKETVSKVVAQGKTALPVEEFRPTAELMRSIFEDSAHCECRDTSNNYNFVSRLIARDDPNIFVRLREIFRRGPTTDELFTEFAAEQIAMAAEAFDRGAGYEAATHYESLPSDLAEIVSDIGEEGADLTDTTAASVDHLQDSYPEIYREASERYREDRELFGDNDVHGVAGDEVGGPPPPIN